MFNDLKEHREFTSQAINYFEQAMNFWNKGMCAWRDAHDLVIEKRDSRDYLYVSAMSAIDVVTTAMTVAVGLINRGAVQEALRRLIYEGKHRDENSLVEVQKEENNVVSIND
jgi:hypothetical protein